jgi:enoyl-CoA hydratase/carnithine racemase
MIAELRKQLELLESNPAVSVVILAADENSKIFCRGRNLLDKNSVSDSLSFLRELYSLHIQLIQYKKPVISVLNGDVINSSSLALGFHAKYTYATDKTVLRVDDISFESLPSGGSSYYLSRLPNGIGMYLALTGDELKGIDLFWSGTCSLYGSHEGESSPAKVILSSTGAFTGDSRTVTGHMESDSVYQASKKLLVESRGLEKMAVVMDNLSEDVSNDMLAEYIRLKRWYSFIAAGDRDSAAAALATPNLDPNRLGDLFDFDQSPLIEDKKTLLEDISPSSTKSAWRTHVGALSAHAISNRDGIFDKGPSVELLQKLDVIKQVFSGNASNSSDGILFTKSPHLPKKITREMLINQLTFASNNNPINPTWESRLPDSLEGLVMRVYERLEVFPSINELKPIVSAVREGVKRSWPTGVTSTSSLTELCNQMHVGERPLCRDLVSASISYITAKLFRLPTPWLLVDPSIISKYEAEGISFASGGNMEAKGFDAVDPISPMPLAMKMDDEDGMTYRLTPRIHFDPFGLMYDFDADNDLFYPLIETGQHSKTNLKLEFNASRVDADLAGGGSFGSLWWKDAVGSAPTLDERFLLGSRASLLGYLKHIDGGAQLYLKLLQSSASSTSSSAQKDVLDEEIRYATLEIRRIVINTFGRVTNELLSQEQVTNLAFLDVLGSLGSSDAPYLPSEIPGASSWRNVLQKVTKMSGNKAASFRLSNEAYSSLERFLKQYVNAEISMLSNDKVQMLKAISMKATDKLDRLLEMQLTHSDEYVVAKEEATDSVKLVHKSTLDKNEKVSAPPPSSATSFSPVTTSASGVATPKFTSNDSMDGIQPVIDPSYVRSTLTSATELLNAFAMPHTRDTIEAASRVVDSFKSEADGKLANPLARSIDEILSRLDKLVLDGNLIAKDIQESLLRKPRHALVATHALLLKASTLSLEDCLSLEFNALSRLITNEVSLSSSSELDQSTLFAPLPEDMSLPRMKQRESPADVSAWEAALEEAYESGEASGALGDVMRRRYMWFKAPHSGEFKQDDSYSPEEFLEDGKLPGLDKSLAESAGDDEAFEPDVDELMNAVITSVGTASPVVHSDLSLPLGDDSTDVKAIFHRRLDNYVNNLPSRFAGEQLESLTSKYKEAARLFDEIEEGVELQYTQEPIGTNSGARKEAKVQQQQQSKRR